MNNLANLKIYKDKEAEILLDKKMNNMCINFNNFILELKENNILILLKECNASITEINKIDILIIEIEEIKKERQQLEAEKGMFSFLTKSNDKINKLEDEISRKTKELETVISNFNLILTNKDLQKIESSDTTEINKINKINLGIMEDYVETNIILKINNINSVEELKLKISTKESLIKFSQENKEMLAKIILLNLEGSLLKIIANNVTLENFTMTINSNDIEEINKSTEIITVKSVPPTVVEPEEEIVITAEETVVEPEEEIVITAEETVVEPEEEIVITAEETVVEPEEEIVITAEETVVEPEEEIVITAEETVVEPEEEIVITAEETVVEPEEEIVITAEETVVEPEEEIVITAEETVVEPEDLFEDALNINIEKTISGYTYEEVEKDALL